MDIPVRLEIRMLADGQECPSYFFQCVSHGSGVRSLRLRTSCKLQIANLKFALCHLQFPASDREGWNVSCVDYGRRRGDALLAAEPAEKTEAIPPTGRRPNAAS